MMSTNTDRLVDYLDDGASHHLVSWIIKMPEHSGAFPAGNRIASLILSRFITRQIKSAGISCKDGACLGEFNFSINLLPTGDPKPAAKIVVEVLESCELLGFSRVFWWDVAERVFRCVHPPGYTLRLQDFLNIDTATALSESDRLALDELERLSRSNGVKENAEIDPLPEFPPL